MTEIVHNGVTIDVREDEELIDDLIKGTYKLRVMLYGPSGTGKSRMAATFPGKKGVIDMDNGGLAYMLSSSKRVVKVLEDTIIDKDKPTAWLEAKAGLDLLCQDSSIDVIVIDSFTTLTDACMKYVMDVNKRTQTTYQDWGQQMELVTNYLFKAFGSGKHVIGVFHEETEKDELTGQLWCRPLATGKLSKKMPNYFDEVYYMQPKEIGGKTEYQIITKAGRIYSAKSRLDTIANFPQVMKADFVPIVAGLKKVVAELVKAQMAGRSGVVESGVTP